MKMVNGRLLRVEPSGAWNQYWEEGVEGDRLGRSGIRPYRALGGVVRSRQSRMVGGTLLRSKAMEGGGGKRRVGRWVDLGKGGMLEGKRTGFSHLFPDDSMQVVDFPRMYDVRHFWGGEKEPQRHRGTEASRKQQRSIDVGRRRATECPLPCSFAFGLPGWCRAVHLNALKCG